jgi:hypothetical protein
MNRSWLGSLLLVKFHVLGYGQVKLHSAGGLFELILEGLGFSESFNFDSQELILRVRMLYQVLHDRREYVPVNIYYGV